MTKIVDAKQYMTELPNYDNIPDSKIIDRMSSLGISFKAPESLMSQLSGRTLYIGQELQPEPQVNPNEILHNMLDHVHDGNREELVGELILMLGWLHKGGTMPNISKDTVTSTTLWIIPTNE